MLHRCYKQSWHLVDTQTRISRLSTGLPMYRCEIELKLFLYCSIIYCISLIQIRIIFPKFLQDFQQCRKLWCIKLFLIVPTIVLTKWCSLFLCLRSSYLLMICQSLMFSYLFYLVYKNQLLCSSSLVCFGKRKEKKREEK